MSVLILEQPLNRFYITSKIYHIVTSKNETLQFSHSQIWIFDKHGHGSSGNDVESETCTPSFIKFDHKIEDNRNNRCNFLHVSLINSLLLPEMYSWEKERERERSKEWKRERHRDWEKESDN